MNKERPVVSYEVWRNTVTMVKVFDWCFEHKNTDIIIDCAKENSIFMGDPEDIKLLGGDEWKYAFDNAVDKVKEWNSTHGNRLILILGNYKPGSVDRYIDDVRIEVHNNPERFSPAVPVAERAIEFGLFDEVHVWPNYFLTWQGFKIFKHAVKRVPFIGVDMDKLFILKIRQAKTHRILLLDELAQRDLLTRNMFTCLDPLDRLAQCMETVGATHYNKGKRGHDNISETDDIYNEQPAGWNSTFMDLVSETHIGSNFYTEKTMWPLAYMKPFLIHGARYQNHDLKKMGFKLYDEVFDYSFDKIASPRARTQALADELLRLQKAKLDYNQIYVQLQPKLEHNMRRLIELFDHDEYMPAPIKKYGHRIWKQQQSQIRGVNGTVSRDPEMGSWFTYIDSDGRNQMAMDLIRQNPYLAQLYYGKL